MPPSRWLVPALAMATFVAMLHAMAIGPLIPDIAGDLDTSVALLGQIPALTMLLAAGLGLVAGPLVDRVGHRSSIVGSTVAVAISALVMGLAPGYLALLLAALIGAAGRAIVQPVALVIAGARYEGDRQRRAISWVMAGITGAVIAGIPALTTAAGLFGWRVAMGTLAALVALLVVALYRILGADPVPERASELEETGWSRLVAAYRPLIAHRPTVALLGGSLIGNSATWMMATYLGAFYDERHGFTTQQIGWVYFIPGVMLFAGSVLAGGRIGALPLRPIVVLTRIAVGIAIFGAYAPPVTAMVSLGFLGFQGLALGISNVAIVLLLMQESPAGRTTTLTLNAAVISLSTALGSMLGGAILAVAGFTLIGVTALLLSVAAAALVWAIRAPAPVSTALPAARSGPPRVARP